MSLHCSKNEPALGFQLLLFFSQTRFSWTSCVLQHRLHCWCSGDARRWGKGKRFVSFSQLVITSIMQKTLWSTLSKESLHILTFLARSFWKQIFSPSREITCVISSVFLWNLPCYWYREHKVSGLFAICHDLWPDICSTSFNLETNNSY